MLVTLTHAKFALKGKRSHKFYAQCLLVQKAVAKIYKSSTLTFQDEKRHQILLFSHQLKSPIAVKRSITRVDHLLGTISRRQCRLMVSCKGTGTPIYHIILRSFLW